MTHSDVQLEPAYVLHRRAYRETSQILEVFSRGHGRVGLIAKGVRRRRSRWAGLLEPFKPLLLSWRGRGELATLTGVDDIQASVAPSGRRIYSAFYLNELLLRLLARHDPHSELFDTYANIVNKIIEGACEQAALRIFEKRLLSAIGYGLITDRDVASGQPIDADHDYWYVAEAGPTRSDAHLDGHQISGSVLIALAHERFDDHSQLEQAKHLMRFVLQPHLGDRPLASRTLYSRPL